MSKFFNGLLLGIILGAVGFWFVEQRAQKHPDEEKRYEDSAAKARDAATETAQHLSDALQAKLQTLHLSGDEIKDELQRTGKIFRRTTQDIGEKAQDAASDARVVAAVKAKFIADPDLSAWNISVGCDQGHVTLSGAVSEPGHVGKAVALALEVDGVRDVTSTLEVKPKQ